IQSDGTIVVVGETHPIAGSGGFNMMVARYTPTGDPDTTFGQQRFVLIHNGQSNDFNARAALVLGPSHSVLPVGYFAGQGSVPQDFMVAKVDQVGVLDPFFGQ